MYTEIMDSQINHDQLDKLIADKPELAVLKHMGSFEVEVEGSVELEDNRFSAPYQDHIATGGTIDKVARNIKVEWFPSENDLEHLKEQEDVPPQLLKTFESLIKSEPRKMIRYDITSILTDKCMEELEIKLIEE